MSSAMVASSSASSAGSEADSASQSEARGSSPLRFNEASQGNGAHEATLENGGNQGASSSSTATETKLSPRESAPKRGDVAPEYRGSSASDEPYQLPSELRRILTEVASTGTCPWLPWSQTTSWEPQRPPGQGLARIGGTTPSESASAPHSSGFMRDSRSSVSPWTALGARQNPLLVSALHQHSATLNQQHQRRFQSSSPTGSPARKKHRNGLFGVKLNRRFGDGKGPASSGGAGERKSRKRAFIQSWNAGGATTTTTTTTTTATLPLSSSPFAAGSALGARASGSDEPGDTSQSYDSEGTSASDVSGRKMAGSVSTLYQPSQPRRQHGDASYSCQKAAFREAAGIVLDYFFYRKGGYTLSPAEKARNTSLAPVTIASQTSTAGASMGLKSPNSRSDSAALDAENVFLERRERILSMLEPASSSHQSSADDDPPYTIQRVAEVLLSPGRYYSQAHKLCNALEKLLLITSSTRAFGGYSGGMTAQSLREDQEIAALAAERRRIQAELRRRRLRHPGVNHSSEDPYDASSTGTRQQAYDPMDTQATMSSGSDSESPGDENMSSAGSELIEAAARASLRSKFDHVGIEPGSNRGDGRPGSPPPPNLSISASAAPPYVLPGHGGYSPPGKGRTSSPILFGTGEGVLSPSSLSGIPASAASIHLLQMQHQSHVSSPLDLMSLHHQASSAAPLALASGSSSFLNSTMTMMLSKEVDLESRSSASSDFDSESDVSFDDSASDRSDGSDLDTGVAAAAAHSATAPATLTATALSPLGGPLDPLSATRSIALSRMQQHQQQRMQSQRMQSAASAGASPSPPAAAASPASPARRTQSPASGGKSGARESWGRDGDGSSPPSGWD